MDKDKKKTGRDDSEGSSTSSPTPAAPTRARSDLRKRAEAKARASEAEAAGTPSPAETKKLLHELRVHQIELEMQNEELRQAQDALGVSRARYFELYDLAPVGYLTLNEAGLILEANLTAATLLGVARSALVKQPLTGFVLSEDQDVYYWHRKRLFDTGAPQACRIRLLREGAAPFWARIEAAAARNTDGSPMCRALISDITEHRQAEEALRESEERYRRITEAVTDYIYTVRIADGRAVETRHGPGCVAVTGYTNEEFAADPYLWQRMVVEADRQATEDQARRLLAGESVAPLEHRLVRKDGQERWVRNTPVPHHDPARGLVSYDGLIQDITERKQAEEAVRQSEKRFRLLFEQAADSIFLLDIVPDGIPVIRDANSAAFKVLGYEREELIGQPLTLIEPTHDILKLADARRQGILSGARAVFEVSHRCKDGTIREFECSAAEMQVGSTTLAVSVERDITERKQAEAERESLGMQLRQAQKMEAVGQLAGGVAHDFNNALTVILGFAELALRQLNPLDPLRHHMNEIISAVDKSANLTRQLLAFARRQIVTPLVLDLNVAIASLAKMLPRLLGEDIELRIVPSEGLWNVHIDPSQVDQILINLVTNARDAVANTGAITVETANVGLGEERCRRHPGVAPGDYVALIVSDTGAGMDKATMERIFDPFFTTKAEGKGTGLGLATVYGIAKQNGGFVDVYSEPGHGTTFKVYLPRFVGAAEQPEPKREPVTLRGTETVLVVEDEPALLEIIQESLQELGYEVLAANSPGDAMRLCETHAKEIHVLVTDVVMPTMNGRQLQQRLEQIRPGLRTIFMSGYTADIVAHRGIVEGRMLFVQKPFTIEALAAKIREALED